MVVYAADKLTGKGRAYDLLAWAVRENWQMAPLPVLSYGEKGKPLFSGLVGKEFNLSHSGAMALCALDDKAVGVDIQIVRPYRAGLLEQVCSPDEKTWLYRDEALLRQRFTLLWTMKEAKVKCSGRGLTLPVSNIRVPLPPEGESLLKLGELWFRLYQGDHWCAAVCGFHQPPETIQWVDL